MSAHLSPLGAADPATAVFVLLALLLTGAVTGVAGFGFALSMPLNRKIDLEGILDDLETSVRVAGGSFRTSSRHSSER